MNSLLLYHDPFNVNIPLLPGPAGSGRGRIAAILEACTGTSLLRPDAPRAVQQDHARKVAEARAALRLDATPIKPRRQRKPRKPTLVSVAKQASKAEIDVARYEVKPDGTVVIITGQPESASPENPWPLDEFRMKETKQ